jgi:hypothetical protein
MHALLALNLILSSYVTFDSWISHSQTQVFESLRLDVGNKETCFNLPRLTQSGVSKLDLVALEL